MKFIFFRVFLQILCKILNFMLFLQVFIVRKGGSAYNRESIGRKQGGREYGQQENGCSDFWRTVLRA